ncbi:HNH endonuclease [Hydrogenophaga sp.]|uniref:HNH endonuclease n=1 Tax=Hydrogenophaga sp. TaxID=1904254 RepID=UPI003F72D0A8
MKKLPELRRIAFQRQCGLCIYCRLPMIPREAIDQFSAELAISPQQAHEMTATAEHLQARCDGGADTEMNVAAAHLVCNTRRHRMRPAPPPEKYKAMVQVQLARGCWLKKALRQRLDAALAMPLFGDKRGFHTSRS